jgi:hypothetical protein
MPGEHAYLNQDGTVSIHPEDALELAISLLEGLKAGGSDVMFHICLTTNRRQSTAQFSITSGRDRTGFRADYRCSIERRGGEYVNPHETTDT